jgi:hypothetical protein
MKLKNFPFTVAALFILSMTELLITGTLNDSAFLWVLYGIYKFVTHD